MGNEFGLTNSNDEERVFNVIWVLSVKFGDNKERYTNHFSVEKFGKEN